MDIKSILVPLFNFRLSAENLLVGRKTGEISHHVTRQPILSPILEETKGESMKRLMVLAGMMAFIAILVCANAPPAIVNAEQSTIDILTVTNDATMKNGLFFVAAETPVVLTEKTTLDVESPNHELAIQWYREYQPKMEGADLAFLMGRNLVMPGIVVGDVAFLMERTSAICSISPNDGAIIEATRVLANTKNGDLLGRAGDMLGRSGSLWGRDGAIWGKEVIKIPYDTITCQLDAIHMTFVDTIKMQDRIDTETSRPASFA